MNILRTASLLLSLTCATLVSAGQKEVPPVIVPPNVGQVDIVDDWGCSGALNYQEPLPYTEMPMAFSLTTTGGPVLLTLAINMWAVGTATMFSIIPMVDQFSINADVNWFETTRGLVTLTRLVQLPAGAHRFSVMIGCDHNATIIGGWLTAYELPSVTR